MPYMQETVIAGNVVEKRKYHSARYPGKKLLRGTNRDKTKLPQWKVNERNAIKRLYWLILTNFSKEDIRLDLTYKGKLPTEAEAYRLLTNFIDRLKRRYKKMGADLKWIAVTECDGHRIHHHLLINNVGIGRSTLAEIWPFAKIDYRSFRYYDGEREDAERVAAYFVKETRETYCQADTIQKQRWRASRNLKPPQIIKQVIQSKSWRTDPKPLAGYYIRDVKNGITEDGYPFQFYRMIREDDDDESSYGTGK